MGISAADICTGMYALTGILGALVRRGRTGEGANIKIAMLDALAEWTTQPMLRKAYAGSLVPRSPTNHPAIAPYGAHKTKDGQVIFGIQNDREWTVFCDKVMGQPEMLTDPRYNSTNNRRENRVALTRQIEDRFAPLTSLEVVKLLDDNGIANGRLNDAQDVWDHPQLAARDRWREVQTEHGPYRGLLPPFTFTDVEMGMGPVPAIGQHTDAILAELGYDAADIAAMHALGAV